MGRAGNQSEVADGNAVSAGILTEWLDDKGYGWVEMEGKSGSSGKVGKGGRRVFAHIKEFGKGQRRPRKGDKVTFTLSRDEQGRPRAVDVRLKSWGGGAWLLLACLLVLPMWAGVKLLGPVFYMLPSWMLVMSMISLLLYYLDKRRAQREQWRISELILHVMDLLGGWPGGFLAQRWFRHKTRKGSFQFVFWMIVVAAQIIAGLVIDGRFLEWLDQMNVS